MADAPCTIDWPAGLIVTASAGLLLTAPVVVTTPTTTRTTASSVRKALLITLRFVIVGSMRVRVWEW